MALQKTSILMILLVAAFLLVIYAWRDINKTIPQSNSNQAQIISTDDLTIIKLTSLRNGNYTPQLVRVKLGTKIRIEGDPESLSGPMDTVIVDGYGVSKKIFPGDNILEFVANKSGQFLMHCANGMGNGTLIVE